LACLNVRACGAFSASPRWTIRLPIFTVDCRRRNFLQDTL
jgi:hypothetical protein